MRLYRCTQRRQGSIVPLTAAAIVGLAGSLALAIDLGMIAIARSHCQNAADSAAMAGARTISGDDTNAYNLSAVPGNAIAAAIANKVLSKSISGSAKTYTAPNSYSWQSGQVLVEAGSYAYIYNDGDTSKEKFELQFPRQDTTEPYSACRVTVNAEVDMYFSRIFGQPKQTVSATATAVHRPRDVVIIMDLSGSMRFQSLPGTPLDSAGTLASPSSNSRPRVVSLNPESVFPRFGHYSNVAAAALQGTKSWSTGSEEVDLCNISTSSNSGPPIAEDFFQNAAGVAPGSGNRAFSRAPDNYDTTPGGDDYLKIANNTGASYAATPNEIFSAVADKDVNFERKGYDAYVSSFKGYTQGPGYWGKTFFIWPPDPRGSTLDANVSTNHADNGAKDWRQRFFFKYNTTTKKLGWLDHNSIMFNSAGSPATNSKINPTPIIKTPGTTTTVTEAGVSTTYTYRINYAAIFHWLRDHDPKPFPTQLRAGRIKYYDAIPDPSDTGLNNRFWTTATLPNLNERFWKSYIDFVLGLNGTGASTYTNVTSSVPLTAMIGNGDMYAWGTVKMSAKPNAVTYTTGVTTAAFAVGHAGDISVTNVLAPKAGYYVKFGSDPTIYKITAVPSATTITLDVGLVNAVANATTISYYSTIPKYMDYDDNLYRPKHQFWFGPMTLIDYLGNYNTSKFWWPGNVHEAQAWACKVGIQSAIDDIKKNHPNDFIALAFFSDPKTSASDAGYHNRAVVPLGRNYQQLKDSLWFPPTTITGGVTEITPYDADFSSVPRASGGTAPGMGFMIAYNLLSSSSTLRFYAQPQPQYRGNAGGLGRKGAQRMIIFETDGAPNTRAMATITGSGSSTYYPIRILKPDNLSSTSNVEWPSGGTYSNTDVYTVVDQICKLDSASPPGYSTTRKAVTVHPIGYGSIFDPANSSSAQTNALTFMQNIAYKGGTATTTNAADFPDSRRIYGTNEQRIERIRNAFSEIMQSGVQVSLIE